MLKYMKQKAKKQKLNILVLSLINDNFGLGHECVFFCDNCMNPHKKYIFCFSFFVMEHLMAPSDKRRAYLQLQSQSRRRQCNNKCRQQKLCHARFKHHTNSKQHIKTARRGSIFLSRFSSY